MKSEETSNYNCKICSSKIFFWYLNWWKTDDVAQQVIEYSSHFLSLAILFVNAVEKSLNLILPSTRNANYVKQKCLNENQIHWCRDIPRTFFNVSSLSMKKLHEIKFTKRASTSVSKFYSRFFTPKELTNKVSKEGRTLLMLKWSHKPKRI